MLITVHHRGLSVAFVYVLRCDFCQNLATLFSARISNIPFSVRCILATLKKMVKEQISLPHRALEARKRHPFRVEPPRKADFREYLLGAYPDFNLIVSLNQYPSLNLSYSPCRLHVRSYRPPIKPTMHRHTYYKDKQSSHEDGHHNKLQQTKSKYPTESTQTKHCDSKVNCDHTAHGNTRHKYEERASVGTKTNI